MQRISLAWFSNCGIALAPIWDSSRMQAMSVANLASAKQFLLPLSDEGGYPLDLRASRPVIYELLGAINLVLNETDPQDQQKKLDDTRWHIWLAANRLETILLGEFAIQPTYHVWPKRAYNVETLVAKGEQIFSEEVRKELQKEELYDAREAGRCLAFEIPTAAAFHIFRFAESLLRRYYEVVVGTLPKLKARNWGVYIKNLRACGADEKILLLLEQIKDTHRNPVIHPDEKMSLEQALSLIGIIDSAMTPMVADMKRRRETTGVLPFPAIPPKQPANDQSGAASA
jgi:hypothetical protein